MAVLIEDMDMPKSCPCELAGIGYGMYCSFVHGIPARAKEYDECCEKGTRPDWCPLIEVQEPHGDLIDRDKLREKEFVHDGDAYAVVMSRDIRNAPTIISASKETE